MPQIEVLAKDPYFPHSMTRPQPSGLLALDLSQELMLGVIRALAATGKERAMETSVVVTYHQIWQSTDNAPDLVFNVTIQRLDQPGRRRKLSNVKSEPDHRRKRRADIAAMLSVEILSMIAHSPHIVSAVTRPSFTMAVSDGEQSGFRFDARGEIVERWGIPRGTEDRAHEKQTAFVAELTAAANRPANDVASSTDAGADEAGHTQGVSAEDLLAD